jgi:hypothetical protein
MPPTDQLRYASPGLQCPPTASASRIDPIAGFAATRKTSPAAIECLADGLGDVALCLDGELCRGSWLRVEEQRPPRQRHHLRRRIDRLVLAPLWPPGRRHDARRGGPTPHAVPVGAREVVQDV